MPEAQPWEAPSQKESSIRILADCINFPNWFLLATVFDLMPYLYLLLSVHLLYSLTWGGTLFYPQCSLLGTPAAWTGSRCWFLLNVLNMIWQYFAIYVCAYKCLLIIYQPIYLPISCHLFSDVLFIFILCALWCLPWISRPLELALQSVVSCPVGVGNWTWILQKSSQCS